MGDYIGIDLHKTKSFVTRMTAQGQILEQGEPAPHHGGLTAIPDGLAGRRAPGGRSDGELDVAV